MANRKKPNRGLFEFLTKVASRRILRVPPPEVAEDTLRIDKHHLDATVSGLRDRSDRRRESAAIWIGRVDGAVSTVTEVRFYHDLCDDKGEALSIQLTEEAKFSLYQELAERGLKLIGTIHTHPEDWVDLSGVDRSNQLCSRIGFWSLVLPYYAKHPWSIKTAGVHIRVDLGWHWFSTKEARRRISVR